MKKLVLLLFGLFFAVAMLSCTNGSDLSVDLDEFIGAPTQLSVDGTVLSWTAVEEARGYVIYVDDEEVDDTKDTSFDFSSMLADRMIFRVQTKAPRGMQDSALSASVAYVANKDEEIADTKVALAAAGMSVSDEFAEELVNKGMLASEVTDMADGFNDFLDAIDSASDIQEIYEAFDNFFGEVENLEAVVSAFVVSELPQIIQEQIDELESNILYWEQSKAYNPYNRDYYNSLIDQAQTELAALEDLLDEVNDNPDSIVLAITSTMEYFISVEEMISEDLVDSLMNISEVEEASDLNAAELFTVKEEVVNILRETMPSQEDMDLIFQVYDLLMLVSGTSSTVSSEVENLSGKLAVQAMYTIEAFINFLDALDEDYFNDLVGYLNGDYTDPMAMAEIAIMTIEYFDSFKSDNQTLLDTINEVFTDEEKEILYNDYLATLGDFTSDSGITSISFQSILVLEDSFGSAFDEMLDMFVERDGELLRQLVIMNSYRTYYYSEEYYNDALDEEYDTYREMTFNEDLTRIQFLEELAYVLQAGYKELSAEDYSTFLDVYLNIVVLQLTNGYGYYLDTLPDTSVFEEAITTLIDNSAEQQFELLTGFGDFVLEEDVFQLMTDFTTSMYVKNDSEYENYASFVIAIQLYDDFMTNANRDLVDEIEAAVILILMMDDIQDFIDLTDSDVTDMEDQINDLLDYLDDNASTINAMDWEDLSASDFTAIDDFQQDVTDIFIEISTIE